MTIRIHIDRLILEGLPIGHHEGPLVQAAVEAELAGLMGSAQLSLTGGAISQLGAPSIVLGGSFAHLGRDIARSLHGGLAK